MCAGQMESLAPTIPERRMPLHEPSNLPAASAAMTTGLQGVTTGQLQAQALSTVLSVCQDVLIVLDVQRGTLHALNSARWAHHAMVTFCHEGLTWCAAPISNCIRYVQAAGVVS